MTEPCTYTVTSALGQSNVPAATRSLSTMAAPDYVDLFTLTTTGVADRSPEWWARAALEDVAGLGGQFIWRVLLGLRLGWRAAPDRVAGWQIADRGDSWIRLEAGSWLLTAHLVVQVDDGRASVATFIRYNRTVAAQVWRWLSVVHRREVPGLLREASRAGSRDRRPDVLGGQE